VNRLSDYAIIRAHDIATRLLPPQVISQLAYAKNLREVVTILHMTEYGEYISREIEPTPEYLHEQIKKVFIKRCLKLLKVSSEELRDILLEVLRIFEIENLLFIFKKKWAGEKADPSKLVILPFSTINYSSLIETKNVEEFIRLLTSYDVYSEFRSEIISLMGKFNSPLPIEYELYRIRYKRLFDVINKQRFLPDKREIEKIFQIEVDIMNIFLALAPMLYDFSPELIDPLLLPSGHKINIKTLKNVVRSKNRSFVMKALRSYKDIVENIIIKREGEAYVIAQRYLRKELLAHRIPSFISPYYVLSLLKRCEYEFRDLSVIVHGIFYNIPHENIARFLISIYN